MTTDQAKQALEQIRAGFEALGFATSEIDDVSARGFRILEGDSYSLSVSVGRQRGIDIASICMITLAYDKPISIEMSARLPGPAK